MLRTPRRELQFVTSRLTALLAAFIVYMSVPLVTILVPSLAYRLLTRLTPWESAAAPVVALVVAVPICAWSVRVIRRFCGRLVPMRFSGEHMHAIPGVDLAMLAPALAFAGASVYFGRSLLERSLFESSRGASAVLEETVRSELMLYGTCCVAFAIQSSQYFRRPPPKSPYILYLRTFLGFSDRAMMATLFTINAGRKRIAVLTAPRSDSASWDPVLIAFRGNPILRPWARSPVFLRGAGDWESAVSQLVGGASHVLIDVSDLSPGVQTEIEIVGREGISKKVIWLCESSKADRMQLVRSFSGSAQIRADRVIFYTRSWTAAWRNLLVGLCICVLFLSLLPALADPVLTGGGGDPWLEIGKGWAAFFGSLIGRNIFALLFFALVFARPAVDRQAQKNLRALLAAP